MQYLTSGEKAEIGMYYHEEIINGVLCFKNIENGYWIPVTAEKLTSKIVRMEAEIEYLRDRLEIARRKVHDPI